MTVPAGESPRRNRLAGDIAGLSAILLWSTTVAGLRSLSEQIGTLYAGALMHGVAGLLGIFFLLLRRDTMAHLRGLPRKYLLVCGACFVVYTSALALAVGLAADHQQVMQVGLVNYLWPSLTIVLSLVLLGKRANLLLVPGTLLALAGVFLAMTQGSAMTPASFLATIVASPAPCLLGLVAAVTWALYSTLTRKWAADSGAAAIEIFMPLSGAVLLVAAVTRSGPVTWTGRAVTETLVLGGITAAGYGLWDVAMRKGDVVFVASCSYLTPFLSMLLVCLYLGASAGVPLWAGCALIIAGSALSRMAVRKRDE